MTSVTRTAATDERGRFVFLSLPVGVYEITAQHPGFATHRTNVVVTIGARIVLALALQLGARETVIVVSDVPLLQPTRSEISSIVEQNLISGLPVNGRNFADFVRLVPFVSRTGAAFTVAGQRGQNLLLLDGADDHNTFFGSQLAFSPSPYQVSVEAVQEFQVNVNAYSAEYGRAGAGVVNVVTKSGTNDLHGGLFWFYRDKALNAADPVRHETDPLHVNQFGGTLGGAIRKNALFFFVNYDGQRRTEGNPTTLNLPATFTPSPKPDVAAYQQLALNYLQPRAAPWVRTYDQDVLFSKVDWQIGPAHRLTGRWNRHRFSGANLETVGLQNSLEHTGASLTSDDALAVTLTSTVSTSMVNVFRASYVFVDQPGASNTINPEAQVFEGGQNVLTVGRLPVSPRLPSSRRTELSDTLTFVRGRHTVEAGLNVLADRIAFSTAVNFSGSYRFNSLESFGRSLAGVPAPVSGERYIQAFSGEGTPGVRVHPNFVDVAAFVQDEWRVRSNLTFNLGVRYDAEVFATPDVKNPSPVLAAAGIDTSVIPTDWNNVAPRLGVAWVPRSRVVIRAGYGIFHGRTAAGHAARPFFQNGFSVQTRTFAGGTPAAAMIPAYPNTVCGPPDPSGAPPSCPPPVAGNDTLQIFSAVYEQPRVHQGSAGIDFQWGRDLAVSVSYMAIRGTDLHRYRDINLGTSATPQTIGIAGTGTVLEYHAYTLPRPLAGFDRVLVLEGSGRSTYDGLAVQVTKRLSHGLQVMSAYTLGRALDDISNPTPINAGPGDVGLLADSVDNSQNWGLAPADRRHIFVLGGIWGSNGAGRMPTAARRVLNGWQLSGVVTAQSGLAYSGFVRFDLNNDGTTQTDRTPGTERNAFRMPGGLTVDGRLMRTVPLTSATKLQILVEAFNLFNSASVSEVQSVQYERSTSVAACGAAGVPCLVPQTDHGAARDSTGPRILQVSLKVVF
jgi:outer membrane receptor protein involved in Fe transport